MVVDDFMELRQMDVVDSIFTTNGTEAEILTGVDDHSRFTSVSAWWRARPRDQSLSTSWRC